MYSVAFACMTVLKTRCISDNKGQTLLLACLKYLEVFPLCLPGSALEAATWTVQLIEGGVKVTRAIEATVYIHVCGGHLATCGGY